MGEVGGDEEHVVDAVQGAQHRRPAGVVQQPGEVAVEGIERQGRRHRRAEARLAIGVAPDLDRGLRRERVAARIEDRSQHDAGDRPAQPGGADDRDRAGQVDLALVVFLGAIDAGGAADHLGAEHDVARDPARHVDRRVGLVAKRLHELRHDVRRARQQGGAQGVGGDHRVESLEQRLDHAGERGVGAGRGRRRDAGQPAEEPDLALVMPFGRRDRRALDGGGRRLRRARRCRRAVGRRDGRGRCRGGLRRRRSRRRWTRSPGQEARPETPQRHRAPPCARSAPREYSRKTLCELLAFGASQPIACSAAIQSGAVATKASVDRTIAVLTSPGKVW